MSASGEYYEDLGIKVGRFFRATDINDESGFVRSGRMTKGTCYRILEVEVTTGRFVIEAEGGVNVHLVYPRVDPKSSLHIGEIVDTCPVNLHKGDLLKLVRDVGVQGLVESGRLTLGNVYRVLSANPTSFKIHLDDGPNINLLICRATPGDKFRCFEIVVRPIEVEAVEPPRLLPGRGLWS